MQSGRMRSEPEVRQAESDAPPACILLEKALQVVS